jgi:hypothetical protein
MQYNSASSLFLRMRKLVFLTFIGHLRSSASSRRDPPDHGFLSQLTAFLTSHPQRISAHNLSEMQH